MFLLFLFYPTASSGFIKGTVLPLNYVVFKQIFMEVFKIKNDSPVSHTLETVVSIKTPFVRPSGDADTGECIRIRLSLREEEKIPVVKVLDENKLR